ncbi:hypothetical protein ACHHV8_11240 [Paenibacillus sp. TAB 01]|uniref:hypothetical protein n=1 Tax=Paenibacillus sp. TAB 01 TaxID=3368988 RepID=UPI00375298CC
MYKINLDSKAFTGSNDFNFVGRKVADYQSFFDYIEILKDTENNLLINPIRSVVVVNMLNEATYQMDNSISAWRFKYKGNGEYNPSDPLNQTPWIFVSKELTTTKILNWAYGLLTAYSNQYGELVGFYFSRNNGTTWSSLSNAEDLVNITTQPSGQSLRIKIAAKHDYEIIAYAFGGME